MSGGEGLPVGLAVLQSQATFCTVSGDALWSCKINPQASSTNANTSTVLVPTCMVADHTPLLEVKGAAGEIKMKSVVGVLVLVALAASLAAGQGPIKRARLEVRQM